MRQKILWGAEKLTDIIRETGAERIFLVCGRSFERLPIRNALEQSGAEIVRFSVFSTNPRYEEAREATLKFHESRCGAILAIGGGSVMDVAKCVKLFYGMNPARKFLEQPFRDTGVPLIAVPTTAGSGSESTRYAVIYADGVKQSVAHESILPDYALMEPSSLDSLPPYPKICAALDALCQGIESWWSIRSTEESRQISRKATEIIVRVWKGYLRHGTSAAEMMKAANLSGQAINLTETTAPHAMSYKLTSLYGIPHGHAVALCMPEVWEETALLADVRLREILRDIESVISLADFRKLLSDLDLPAPCSTHKEEDLISLTNSINAERLRNHPVSLNCLRLYGMYERIVKNG